MRQTIKKVINIIGVLCYVAKKKDCEAKKIERLGMAREVMGKAPGNLQPPPRGKKKKH